MGLQTRSNSPITFIQFNARSGKLVTRSKDGEGKTVKDEHDAVDGVLSRVFPSNDEYEGVPRVILNVDIKDGGMLYRIAFNADTRAALEVMGRLNAADVGHPVRIGGYVIEKGSKMADGTERTSDLVGATLRQGANFGTKIDPFYSEALGNKTPKAIMLVDDAGNVVKIKGVEQYDKEASTAQQHGLIAELITSVTAKIEAAKQGQSQGQDDGVDADVAAQSAMRARA